MTQRNKWYKPPSIEKYWNYANELKKQLPNYELSKELTIVFNLPMPKSWSNKKKAEMVGTYHNAKPDIDNLVKGFMDALKSDANDDKHVAMLYCKKYWADEGSIEILQPVHHEIPTQKKEPIYLSS